MESAPRLLLKLVGQNGGPLMIQIDGICTSVIVKTLHSSFLHFSLFKHYNLCGIIYLFLNILILLPLSFYATPIVSPFYT